MEIERKFLTEKRPKSNCMILIKQTYLSYDPEVRIRNCYGPGLEGGSFWLTVKGKGNKTRSEYEIPITKEIYEYLLAGTNNPVLMKTRTKVLLDNGLVAEIDKYEAFDFLSVEVEFESEEQAENFVPPEWFGEEITDIEKYKNKYLAKQLESK